MQKIRIASLFSGIGGFETGIFRAWGKEQVDVVFASEIDKHAATAYETLYGHRPHGDITQIHAKDVPDHDILVGGFPCQAFSVSGKRRGFDDTRGTLFFEIARIAKEKQPKIMVLENVKGLVGHDGGRTLDVIAQTLSDLDYKIDMQVLNSKYHNVPQNRERIYLICHRDAQETSWMLHNQKGVIHTAKKRLQERGTIKTFNFDFPKEEDVTTCLLDILDPHVADKYYLQEGKTKAFVPNPFMKQKTKQGLQQIGYIGKNAQGNRVYHPAGVSPTVSSQTGGLGGSGGGVFAWHDDFLREALEKDVRELVAKSRPNAEISVKFKENGDIRPHRNDPRKSGLSELNINYETNASFTVTASHAPKVYGESTGWRIRKLSPLECFRLQGFPDEYVTRLQEAGVSDRQLYKMAGNAVTTNVIADLFNSLKSYI